MFSSLSGATFALKLKKQIFMKTLSTIALFALLGVAVLPLYAQEPSAQTPQPPEKEQVKEQPPQTQTREQAQTQTQTQARTGQSEEVKQVAPNRPEHKEQRQQMHRERGARPEIVRPGGRPAGAGRPQGARRPGRR